MEPTLIEALLRGMELQVPSEGVTFPVDFIVVGERGTLLFRGDWWQKEQAHNVGILSIASVPRDLGDGHWTFDHPAGYLLAPPSDEDAEQACVDVRDRARFDHIAYHAQLLKWSNSEPDYDFRPWIEATAGWGLGGLQEIAESETRERPVGKILLRDGLSSVVDSLVIDENGFAAVANEDGHLSRYAEQWVSYAPGSRPTMNEFLSWLATQRVYGDFSFDGAGVFSASGDVQEIALRLASDSL